MSDKLLTNCGSGDKYYPVFHGEPGTTKPFRPLDLIIKRPQPILKRPSSKMEIITLDELENHEVVITKITQEDVLVRFAPAASDLAYRFSENCTNAHKFCYKDKMHTPLHEHDLQQVDPLIVYGAFQGRWKCDNCNGENSATSHPFHCSPCSFDLCYSCVHTNLNENSLAHQHQLFYLETSRLLYQNQNGVWRCAVCKKTSDDLRETFSYHCASCADFGICRSCFEPRQHPIHSHVLQLVDTSLVYMQSGGSWVCDICDRQSRPYEKFSHHCVECEFDVCLDCFKPQTSPLHSHPLYKANSHDVYAQFNGGWRCDHCASVHNNPLDNHPWHCPACEYDLCQNCMGGIIEADQTGPSPVLHQIGRNRSFQTQAGIVSGLSFYRRPEENPWLTRDQMLAASEGDEVMSSALTTERGNAVAYPEDTDDNSKCIICMEEPKNATVIHGDTGHCCCCWQCAQVLRMRGDPCPICRAPIDHVIRQFNA